MSALTRTEEEALRAAAGAVRELGPRFAEVIDQAAAALRPYAWATAALALAEEDEACETQRSESGAAWLLDMLSTMCCLLDDAEAVLNEPRDHLLARRQADA